MKLCNPALPVLFVLLSLHAFAGIEEFTLEVDHASGSDPVLQLKFASMRGLKYALFESDNLVDWQYSGANRTGNGAMKEFSVTASGSSHFYEVVGSLDDSILSGITGIDYDIDIYVPSGYHNSTDPYPVIYTTDGQWVFDEFEAILQARNEQVILIGIGEGPVNRRVVDYMLPGADAYFQFLITEIMPAVESIYRIDPDERTIVGTSLGGLFVGLALLIDDVDHPYFKNYLSFEGSFWFEPATLATMAQQRYNANHSMDVNLFLSSALSGGNNDANITRFKAMLEALDFEDLTIIRRSYYVVHGDVFPPSFEEALNVLF